MRYLGGKSRTAKQIAGYIHTVIKPGQAYYEPFCGACWVTCEVHARRRFASDANAGMIALWQALQEGWIPPSDVSKDEHTAAKRGAYADQPHLEAFILIGASFGGVWGAGYAGGMNGNYTFIEQAKINLLHHIPLLQDVTFTACGYQNIEPLPSSLIYCDPPYENTSVKDYRYFGDYAVSRTEWTFDSCAFWRWAQHMTEQGHTVIVSEYNAPAGWTCAAEMPATTTMRVKGNIGSPRIERLFRYGQHERLQPIMPGFEMVMT